MRIVTDWRKAINTTIDSRKQNRKKEIEMGHKEKAKGNESALFSVFSNWLGGFWALLGGFFKKRIGVITGSTTFTETGCVEYFIDTPDGWNREEFSPQKVWFTCAQPDTTDIEDCNMVTMHRDDTGVWLMGTVNHAPCKVTWIILV
jgi:hypothetical protein